MSPSSVTGTAISFWPCSTECLSRTRRSKTPQPGMRSYLRFNFVPLIDDPHHLFLPMHEIRKLDLPPL